MHCSGKVRTRRFSWALERAIAAGVLLVSLTACEPRRDIPPGGPADGGSRTATPGLGASPTPQDRCAPMRTSSFDAGRYLPRRLVSYAPPLVHANDAVTVRVVGFPANTPVTMEIGRPGDEPRIPIGTATATAGGEASFSFQMPNAAFLVRSASPQGRDLPCVVVVVLSDAGSLVELLPYER